MKQHKNVTISVFNVHVLRYVYPEWDALDKAEKYVLIRNHAPEYQIATSNVTCVGMHRWLARAINPEISVNDGANAILLGDDNSSFSSSDTELNNQTGSVDVSDSTYDDSVPESIFTAFVDSTEQNGITLRETGIESETGRLMNHAEISPAVDKNSDKTVIVEITIQFSD